MRRGERRREEEARGERKREEVVRQGKNRDGRERGKEREGEGYEEGTLNVDHLMIAPAELTIE